MAEEDKTIGGQEAAAEERQGSESAFADAAKQDANAVSEASGETSEVSDETNVVVTPYETADNAAAAQTAKKKPNMKVIIAVAVAVVVVIVAAALFINAENERKAAEEARIAEIEAFNTYIDNLETARVEMLSGCATAETACNLMIDVWHSAIFESNADEWSEDAKPYYATDFNEALAKLFASDLYAGYVGEIKANNDEVEALMKDLRNPPQECERAYDALQDFYSDYKAFTKLATSASGSYQSVSEDFRDLDKSALSKYETMETIIPDKKTLE